MILAKYPKTKVKIVFLADTFKWPSDPFSEHSGAYIPGVTFAAGNISLMTAIEIICKTTGSHFEIAGDRIHIIGEAAQQISAP